MKTSLLRRLSPFAIVAVVLLQLTVGARPAAAAPGAVIADVVVRFGDDGTLWPAGISCSVALDGKYLYYAEYSGPFLHRRGVPPEGGPHPATNKIALASVARHASPLSL